MRGSLVSKRKVVQRVVGRMYRHHERALGRLPDGKTIRAMEEKAKRAAETVDRKRTGR